MIKKLFPLFLFMLGVYIFIPNDSKAESCKYYEGVGKVICGTDSPTNNGEILWRDKKESVGNLVIAQATFNLRESSQVSMGVDSSLIFDPNQEANPSGQIAQSTIELDKSNFFHGKGLNSYAYMKDKVELRIYNDSSLTLGYVRDEKYKKDKTKAEDEGNDNDNDYKETDFVIKVKDSDASFGDIIFKNPKSAISVFSVENEEKNRGKYKVNINKQGTDSINVPRIDNIDFKNADVTISGDVVSTSVGNINLFNSDFIFKGNKLSQVGTINIRDKSIFKADPNVNEHTLSFGGGGEGSVNVESGSKFNAQNVEFRESTTLEAHNKDSELNINKMYLAEDTMAWSKLNMSLSVEAKAKIGTINAKFDGINTGTTSTMTLSGSKDSVYDIGEILLNNKTDIVFKNAYGKINKLNYDNYEVNISGNKTDDLSMTIGSINLLNDNSISDIEIKDQNIAIDDINLKKSDKLNFNFTNSNIKIKNIVCREGCQEISFKGYNDINIDIDNFNSGSTNEKTGKNSFSDININLSGNYNSSGTFEAKNSKLNFGSMNGVYKSISLVESSLTLNKKSDIKLTDGDIKVDGSSKFIVKGEQVFENWNDIKITNSGTLDFQAGNNFHSLSNEKGATASLNGKANIYSINNSGTLNLYTGSSITNLSNLGSLVVHGENRIGNYSSSEDSELLFYVDNKYSNPSLIIKEMNQNSFLNNLAIKFKGLVAVRPGVSNRYDLIKTEKGSININHDEYSKTLEVLPPWLKHEEKIDFNNGVNANNGETAWISIQRLTNYKNLIKLIPEYSDYDPVLSMAEAIDNVVATSSATENLEDVINSLDLNSGCGYDEETQRIIYLIHQGDISLVDKLPNNSCLYTLAENMNKLKPVSNEVYALYSHSNMVKSLDTILEESRDYVYSGEVYTWYKLNLGYTSLADKDKDAGFKSINSSVYVGATFSPINNYNLSGILGLTIGNLAGNNNIYDGLANTLIAGLAGTYLNGTYFMSLSSLVGLTNFNMDRNIDFLDNEYSENRETKSTSKLSTIELALRAEAGNEYLVNSTTFLTPKIFATQSVIQNSGYEEFGSSASLNVDASTLLITDVGIGAELRRELLLPRFLGINNAFWYPKVGINLVERFYLNPTTKMRFAGTSTDYYVDVNSANYSGLLGQLYGSLLYQNQNVAVQVGYNGEVSISGYMNHSANITFKYNV